MHFLLFMCLFFSIGTHYFRGINNLQQPWNSWTGRKKLELKPNNPTEEGLASIHSVLFRKDPFLWRAALLYYTVYRASQMSFCELFRDIGKFVKDPNTRWDYCVRAKRGWTDTSQPGECALTVDFVIYWVTVYWFWSHPALPIIESTHLWKIKPLLLEVSADFPKPHFVGIILLIS